MIDKPPVETLSRDTFFYVKQDNYDEHAELAIPHYVELHRELSKLVLRIWPRDFELRVLDLGTGTGKTLGFLLNDYHKGTAVGIDLFDEMLVHARDRLQDIRKRIEFVRGDFMDVDFDSGFDLCVSALAIHHQSPERKCVLFKKVCDAIKPGGWFMFIDWTKFEYPEMQEVAFDIAAEHVRGTVNRAEVVREWIYHWRNLNRPDTVADLCRWLGESGFRFAECPVRFYGIGLICAVK